MLIGRDPERAAIADVLERARAGWPGSLALVGEPGIGKTALLEDAAAAARAMPDTTVLTTSGSSTEQAISFAALISLVRSHRAPLATLPETHRSILSKVLTSGEPAEPVALGLAVLELLTQAAESATVLVVVDDAHWLDDASARALRFARRRLLDDRIAFVFAVRPGTEVDDDVERVALGGLDTVGSRDLLGAEAGLSPDVAEACREACGGNPLAMLEFARGLSAEQRRSAHRVPRLARPGPRWDRWASERLEDLPSPARTAAGVLALAGPVGVGALTAALMRLGLDLDDLDTAVAAGIVDAGPPPRLTHPLYAGAAVSAMRESERRTAHRALAAALHPHDLSRRAWHLAEGSEGDTAEAIEALVALAARAAASNDPLTASDALGRAATLTEDITERAERLVASANAAWDAGRPDIAVEILRTEYQRLAPGPVRAEAVDVLGQVMGWAESVAGARRLLEAEVAHVQDEHPDLAVSLLVSAARLATLESSRDAPRLATRAEQLSARAGHDAQIAARVMATHVLLTGGSPAAALHDRLAEVDALVDHIASSTDRPVLEIAELAGFALMVQERWDESSATFEAVVETTRRAAFREMENFATAMSAEVAWRTGRWSRARAEALVSVTFHATLTDLRGNFGHATLARTEAALGMVPDAVAHARRTADRGDAIGMGALSAWGRHALGLAALADGRPGDALEPLRWVWHLERTGGVTDPGVLWFHGDLLEALLATGHHDDAARLVAQVDEAATTTGRAWARAVALRGRGMLDKDADALRASAQVLDELGAPFEAARSRLALAELDPRHPPADELDAALDAFEHLGARPWVERAARLRRSPGRTGGQIAMAAVLSPAELRVALAVGRGLSNRDAAEHLALSPRTIDAHLQSIYRKLGISSRSQLAVRVSAEAR